MHVHRSNRIESLVDILAEVVAQPAGDAAAPECIVVQGKGMERWLSIQLAQRFGVWANPLFPFPRKLIEHAITAVLGPDGAPSTCFEPETLMWAVADLLPAHLQRPDFAPIRTYLTDDERGTKRIALAQRIADTFDQYVVYRPQVVIEWERGAGADWQAVLWRALVARHGATHVASRAAAFLTAIPTTPPADFPERVSLFGISTLPPLHLQLLAVLSAHVEVHLFVLSPSREYWADIQSQRQAIRAAGRGGTIDTFHFTEGHPLLASLGRLGRDFQQVLEATGDYEEPGANLYHDPGTDCMLATLQSDILKLVHRGRGADASSLPYRRDDESIRVHACHSPMREVEVLHDQLLAAFDADHTLEPRDVVVMSPAIDAYAPFIEAVFGGASEPRVPYRITDRGVHATEEVVDAFATLLAVLRGRMTATDVLDLLGLEAIRTRFAITGEDLDILRTWITRSGIRWGVDDADRAAADQPRVRENTWRFGLDRLLLGYAMTGNDRTLFHNVLPYDDVEGTAAADLLGGLVDFCEALFALRADFEQPRPLGAWRDALGGALDRMIANTHETADQHQRIRSALADLAARGEQAGFSDTIHLDALRSQLDITLQRSTSSHGFLAGGVTFCALVPMRTIPFRVVCLLGMNDDAFPRAQRPLGFDLIAQRPQPGDRSSREDDRYLFLEALLSARQRLMITYVGQSIRDNTEIPPSVVVSELLDTLDESFRVGEPTRDETPEGIREHIVVRHPLQPFSPRYFGRDPQLFSYAASYCDGARGLVQPRRSVPAFLVAPLPPPNEAASTIALDDLVRFFEHPSRAFLQRRLQLYLGSDTPIVEDREPMELDTLAVWEIGHRLLERSVRGDDLGTAFAAMRASGTLPLGIAGECVYADLRPDVDLIGGRARDLMTGEHCAPVEVDVRVGDCRILGTLRNLWRTGQVRYQFSRLGGRHELGVWIRHLVLNLIAPPSCAADSFVVGRAAGADPTVVVRFRPVTDSAALLQELIDLYRVGQMRPLPLFPRTSRAYAEALRSSDSNDAGRRALAVARTAFEPKKHSPVPSEGEDVYVHQLFGERDPLDPAFRCFADEVSLEPSFAAVACTVFDPLLAHRGVIA